MSIFKQMHELHGFSSWDEFEGLQRMLASAISRGYVEQVSVMKTTSHLINEEVFFIRGVSFHNAKELNENTNTLWIGEVIMSELNDRVKTGQTSIKIPSITRTSLSERCDAVNVIHQLLADAGIRPLVAGSIVLAAAGVAEQALTRLI
jgi:hypothetical protein